ncbi:ABC transporter permease [Candidatus Darwinibacter acetoxidans]
MKERAMNSRFQQLLTKYGTILALVIVTLMFSLFVPGFVNSRNLLNILRQVALLAVIAEGFTMCLIVDELDLSFANVASLASVIAGALILGGMHPFLAIVIVLAVGAGIGLLNGLLVTKVGIPSLITTLAMGIISVGFIYMFTDGLSLYGAMPAGFLFLGRGSIAGIPFLVIIMFAVVLLAHVLVNKFKVGKHMQATGANVRAARLAGINTDFYKILGLVLSSAGAALTGILLTSRLGTANPEGATGFMMDSFASALMGMTVLSIGRAKPLGTLVGVLMIGVISNGMTLAGAPYYMQDITKGVIILLSVTITSLQSKRQADA